MDIRYAVTVALMLLLSPVAGADVVKLSDNHPDTYTVVKGDTLWDISGQFLEKPWKWPEIWDKNPQIENPHLIYPGDIISLSYRNGRPVLSIHRGGKGGRPLVKLSPSIRSTERDAAIPTIPVEAIAPFLKESVVMDEKEYIAAPYVLSPGSERLASAVGSVVFVRGLDENGPRRLGLYRKGKPYSNPGSKEILGYEMLLIGDAIVEEFGDPSTVYIARSLREVLIGDRLLPIEEERTYSNFMPKSPSTEINGHIVSVVDGVSQIGQHAIVILNVGSSDGAQAGDVLSVYQKGATVIDTVKKGIVTEESYKDIVPELPGDQRQFDFFKNRGEEVTLPDQQAGIVMVFRVFDKVSYAIVMEASRSIHIYDRVTNPD